MTALGEMPKNLLAEQALLGAAMLEESAARIVAEEVRGSDLYDGKHVPILDTIASLVAAGTRPDVSLVGNALHQAKRLQQAGGAPYLALLVDQILDGLVTSANVREYARIVRDLALRRRIAERCHDIAHKAVSNGHDSQTLLADLKEGLPLDGGARRTPAATLTLDAPVAVLRRAREQGEPIPTGIKALDERLRGGMRPGKAMIIGGTAGAGKTSLGLQIAVAAADAGCAVACLFADEGREPAIVRLGQGLGYIREQIEEGVGDVLDHMEAELTGRLLFFPDPDSEADATIEGTAESLVQAYPEHRKLLLLDSIQTVTSRATRELPSIRERIMGNARAARRVAVEHGIAVVLTSEVNRSWYRSRKEEDRAADLAAFAEARIEFVGDVLLAMRASDEDPELVDVRIPKNRLGDRRPMLLRLDRARARFAEVADGTVQPGRDAALKRKADEATASILRALDEHQELSRSQLWDVVQGSREAFNVALGDLKAAGIVVPEARGRSMLYRRAEVPK